MKITEMFKDTKSKLDEEIENVLDDMKEMYVDSEEYSTAMGHLKGLYEIKANLSNSWKRVSPDTMAIVVGNLLGIILILKHEDLNIITSKAMGFVLRGRA